VSGETRGKESTAPVFYCSGPSRRRPEKSAVGIPRIDYSDLGGGEVAAGSKATGASLGGMPKASITMKLKRGMFSATFLLACLASLELEGVALEDI
jgi:Domain of unknown function (DUF6471)